MIDADRRLLELGPRGWALFAATVFGISGLLVSSTIAAGFFGIPVREIPTYSEALLDARILVASATIGSIGLGGYFWWRFVESPCSFTYYRGAAIGFLTGFCSLPFMWVVVMIWIVLFSVSPDGGWSGYLLLFYALASILMFGTAVGFAGTFTGILIVRIRGGKWGQSEPAATPQSKGERSAEYWGPPIRWTLKASAYFGFIGLALGSLVESVLFRGEGSGAAFVHVGVTGFVVGGLVWWLGVERRRTYSPRTGTIVGSTTILLTMLIWPLLSSLWRHGLGQASELFLIDSADPLASLRVIFLALAIYSLIPLGFLGMPAGVWAGRELARQRRTKHRRVANGSEGPAGTSSNGDDI